MDVSILENLSDFHEELVYELSREENVEELEKTLAKDEELQKSIIAVVKRTYQFLEPFIDADRMGELIIKSGLSTYNFNKYIAD